MQRWVLLVAIALLGVRLAYAKPKIAVTPIEGDESGDMRDAVADALDGGDLDVISSGKVIKTFDKLGYEGELSEKQARKVAKELEVDAIVQGKLGKSGKNKTLKFTLFVGGKKERGFKVTFNNEKSANFKTKLRDKVAERIDGKASASEDDGEKPSGDDEDTGKKKKKKKKKSALGDGDTEENPDEDPEIEAAVSRVSPHSANRVAVRVDMGVSFQNRTLKFTQRPDFPEGPKTYSNTFVPAARLEGELYPLAFSNPKSLVAGLGLAAEYDRTLVLTLRSKAVGEENNKVPTKQSHWSIGARIRIPFGKSPTSPTVTLGVDYGKRSFVPDRSQLMDQANFDVPTTAYTSVAPGLQLRIPFAPQFAFVGGSKVMLIQNAGPIQSLDEYGRAKVLGVLAHAGFDIVLGNRFAIRLIGEYSQVGFNFVGNGFRTTSLDGDPASKDIGGALDRSFGGAATLAVLY